MGFLNEICGRPDNEKAVILLVVGRPALGRAGSRTSKKAVHRDRAFYLSAPFARAVERLSRAGGPERAMAEAAHPISIQKLAFISSGTPEADARARVSSPITAMRPSKTRTWSSRSAATG